GARPEGAGDGALGGPGEAPAVGAERAGERDGTVGGGRQGLGGVGHGGGGLGCGGVGGRCGGGRCGRRDGGGESGGPPGGGADRGGGPAGSLPRAAGAPGLADAAAPLLAPPLGRHELADEPVGGCGVGLPLGELVLELPAAAAHLLHERLALAPPLGQLGLLELARREEPLRLLLRVLQLALAPAQLRRLRLDAGDLPPPAVRELAEVARPRDHLGERAGREDEGEVARAAADVGVAGVATVGGPRRGDLAFETPDGVAEGAGLGTEAVELLAIAVHERLPELDLGLEPLERRERALLLRPRPAHLLLDARDLV